MSKPPLVFLHGMWSRPRVWDRFKARFEAAGYQTLAPVLPGHDVEPDAPVPPGLAGYAMADYVAAIEAACAPLTQKPVLIGHSLGGLLAQLVGVRIKPKALVLLSPGPSSGILAFSPSSIKSVWPIISRWGYWKQPTLPTREAALYGVFNGVEPDEAEAEIKALVHDSGRVMFQIGMPFLDSSGGTRVDYPRLGCPALIVIGTEDRITPLSVARATARLLPGRVTYREMDGFGHWIIGRQGWPIVADHIAAFLDAHQL